jgi:hypothetical protein
VIVYLPEWLEQVMHFGDGEPTPLARYVKAYGPEAAGRQFWGGYGLIPGGRSAYRLGHLAPKRPASAFRGQDCRAEILYAPHSHFDLYGNYISGFCGGLSVGDWHNLPELLAEYRGERFPPLVALLVESGPYGLYELASQDYAYAAVQGGYVGKCHLCVDVRRCLTARGDFPELSPRQFYDMI